MDQLPSRSRADRTLAAAGIATAAAEPVPAASAGEIEAAAAARRQLRHRRVTGVWLLIVAAMVMTMIVLGALTRLTESGLSMVEWRPVTGWLPPLSEAAWQAEFEKYAASPQGRLVKDRMSVAGFKEIYWLEYVHRLWGRLIGLAVAVPLLLFWWRRSLPPGIGAALVGLLVLGALQGAMGWAMVASGLVDRPAVSHFRLALHLLLALAIFGWLLWMTLNLLRPRPPASPRFVDGDAAMRRWTSWLVVGLTATITYGAFVAGLRAGLVHNTFPTMSGYWLPPGLLDLEPLWVNFVASTAGVQFVHRWLAKAMVLAVLLLWLRARRDDVSPAVRSATNMMLGMVAVQFGLGVATLLEGVPIWLGTLHQAGAVLLLVTAILTLYRASARDEAEPGLQFQPA